MSSSSVTINWNNVLYNESEHKLTYFHQRASCVPAAIINLYHDRVNHLDLSYNELTSLDALDLFSEVEEIVLDNNFLNDDIMFPRQVGQLRLLSLNNNKIENLNFLLTKLSLSFPNLEYLSLLGNPCCPYYTENPFDIDGRDYINYRILVIQHFPKLKFLDTKRVSQMEAKRGQCNPELVGFSRISQMFKQIVNTNWGRAEAEVYSPLPDNLREAGNHKGAYGKCKYKYVGAQSEGNRFIMNNDL